MRAGINKRPIRADSKPILNVLSDTPAVAAYGLRRLNYAFTGAPIRVRDDTNTELDIPFCGQDLCTGTLTSWLGRNQVASIPLGVDGNADGVSDGWSAIQSPNQTTVFSVDGGYQKLEITASTSADGGNIEVVKEGYLAGHTVNISVTTRKSGSVSSRIIIQALTSAGAVVSTLHAQNYTYTTDTIVAVSGLLIPATATKLKILLKIVSGGSGQLGSAWFDDLSAAITNQSAYVTTWYDQSGNGLNATQTTAANQPRIVNAGTLVTDGVRPAIETILANDTYFSVAHNSLLNITTNSSLSIVHNPTSIGEGSAGRILDKGSAQAIALTVTTKLTTNATLGDISNDGAFVLSTLNINTIIQDDVNNQLNYYLNGGLHKATTANTTSTNGTAMYLFNRSGGDRQYDGKCSELILFGVTLSDAQRQKYERNAGKYFSQAVS